ncbi:MAG: hypothetical protein II940_04920, partial [Methanosarcinaceae archaeon]|nr:hypothetical protein [Methanosarcinaceae archaeon]
SRTDVNTYTNEIVASAAATSKGIGNYNVSYVPADLTITKKAITVTIDGSGDTKEYSGSEQTSATTVTPSCDDSLFDADKFSYTGNTTITKTDVGEYSEAIDTAKASYADDNLDVTFKAGTPVTFEITPVAITIKAEDKTKVYDNDASTDPELTATVTGVPENGTDPVYSLNRTAGQDVGNYTITVTAEADDNPNYTVTTEDGNFEITPNSDIGSILRESVSDYNDAYDGQAHGIGLDESNLPSGTIVYYSTDNETWNTTAPTWTDFTDGAKTVYVKAENSNYQIDPASATVTISPRKVTITSGTASKEYDGTSLTDENVTVSGDGFVNGEFPVYEFTGSQTTVGTSENAFTVTFAESEGGLSGSGLRGMAETRDPTALAVNYESELVFGNLTVDPKGVTVTADDKTKQRKTTDPELTVTIEGLIDGESEDLISYEIERESGEDVGTYLISVTGDEEQGNYLVTFIDGTMTIEGSNGYIIHASTSI